jgi:CheY-like chemotaxis protein
VSAVPAASHLPLIEAFGQSIARSIRSRTILVIGDAPLANGLIVRILGRAGFTDIRTVGGSRAVKQIDAVKPDLVLIDSELLELDRTELCSEIRSDPRFANLPIIALLAGRSTGGDRHAPAGGRGDRRRSPAAGRHHDHLHRSDRR